MARKYGSSAAGAGACGGTCGCYILVLLINLTLGSLCLNYALDTMIGTTLPWLLTGVLGLFLGEITIPLAVICLIANLCQVAHPWFPHVIK